MNMNDSFLLGLANIQYITYTIHRFANSTILIESPHTQSSLSLSLQLIILIRTNDWHQFLPKFVQPFPNLVDSPKLPEEEAAISA
jgi:hypothetical protein